MPRWIWSISECNLMTRDSQKWTPMGGLFMRERRGSGPEKTTAKAQFFLECRETTFFVGPLPNNISLLCMVLLILLIISYNLLAQTDIQKVMHKSHHASCTGGLKN